jgi:2-dehydro-3-deoxyphosphogluconate aldolase/(4S)-4-hydroxy-2-oxoglutarate aldolase
LVKKFVLVSVVRCKKPKIDFRGTAIRFIDRALAVVYYTKHMTEREKEIIDCIVQNKIIAIIRGVKKEEQMCMLVDALCRGGIKLAEVTFNQSDPNGHETLTKQLIKIKETFGDRVMIGAGTVLTAEQVDIAAAAHADYIVSPNTDIDVIKRTKQLGLVSIPGAYTASEVASAHRAGADFIKIFPVDVCGEAYIKAIRAPLSQVKLLAVGGVDETNIRKFLDAGCVGAGVGGSLADVKKIETNQFKEIEETAKRLVASIH